MTSPEQILKKLEAFDKRLLAEITKILSTKGLSTAQLLKFVETEEFDMLLSQLGLEEIGGDIARTMDKQIFDTYKGFGKVALAEKNIEHINSSLELMKSSKNRTIVGHFADNTNKLRDVLTKGLLGGTPTSEVIKTMQSTFTRVSDGTKHILTDANMGTIINTAYADISRMTTQKIYEDEPEARFRYVGGTIPTSSPQCEWLMMNQRADGYTMAEIQKGIETPFGIIDWWGRRPNYNCIHNFEKIEVELEEAA